MNKMKIVSLLLLLTAGTASAFERFVVTGGFSNHNPSGAIELQPNYSYNLGLGLELRKDLFAILKFTPPRKYDGTNYPVVVDINGLDTELYFRQFSAFDIMLTGQYFIRLSQTSRIHPKVMGGLGLHWMYNSVSVDDEADVTFYGIGPEFGLGGVMEISSKFQLDFTASVKFPYYNEYHKAGEGTTAVGLDEQIMAFNVSLFYLFSLP